MWPLAGTNHGSLSARTLSFYGDTPRGMVEAAIEFADICRQFDEKAPLFHPIFIFTGRGDKVSSWSSTLFRSY